MSKKRSEWSTTESDSESESSFSSTNSSSASFSNSSSRSSRNKSKRPTNKNSDSFTSESIDLDKSSIKSKTPVFSESDSETQDESLYHSNSLHNLQEDYEPSNKLPHKVFESLKSVQESMINIYNLKIKFKENFQKIKQNVPESKDLKLENEKISDLLVQECLGCLALNQIIYGSSHWKYAMSYTELSLIYLENKFLPKQAKHYCEKAWTVLHEELKNMALHEANKSELQESNWLLSSEVINKHQMMLNYIYGRSCTLLKENENGESILEKAEEFYENWRSDLTEKKLKLKYKDELKSWKLKIYFALAKQYAINNSNGNAIEYYDKCIDCFKVDKNIQIDQLIEVYYDKVKIELKKGNYEKSVDMLNDCLEKVEKIGSDYYVLECKLNLAKIFSELDDMNSSSKAEDLFKECLEGFQKILNGLNEKTIVVKDEFVKFYLKQEKYDDAFSLLGGLLKDKIDLYGDFSSKLNSTYKLISSIHLKKNDIDNAIKNLHKSLEIEELNYGKTDKRYLKTSETLENLQAKIKQNQKSDKKVFNPARKINHYKEDLALYSNNS